MAPSVSNRSRPAGRPGDAGCAGGLWTRGSGTDAAARSVGPSAGSVSSAWCGGVPFITAEDVSRPWPASSPPALNGRRHLLRPLVAGIVPRAADADGDVQRDGQAVGAAHLAPDELLQGGALAGRDL